MLQVLEEVVHERVQRRVHLVGRSLEVSAKLVDVLAFSLGHVRLCLYGIEHLLRVAAGEGTLSTGNLLTLLCLDRAEVAAPTAAMVHEVALPEGLLEILTRLRLETSLVWLATCDASARALGVDDAVGFVLVLAAHD